MIKLTGLVLTLRQFPPSPRLHVAQLHLRGKQMSHLRVRRMCLLPAYSQNILRRHLLYILNAARKQSNFSQYLVGTVSLHKQAKNPGRCFMILS